MLNFATGITSTNQAIRLLWHHKGFFLKMSLILMLWFMLGIILLVPLVLLGFLFIKAIFMLLGCAPVSVFSQSPEQLLLLLREALHPFMLLVLILLTYGLMALVAGAAWALWYKYFTRLMIQKISPDSDVVLLRPDFFGITAVMMVVVVCSTIERAVMPITMGIISMVMATLTSPILLGMMYGKAPLHTHMCTAWRFLRQSRDAFLSSSMCGLLALSVPFIFLYYFSTRLGPVQAKVYLGSFICYGLLGLLLFTLYIFITNIIGIAHFLLYTEFRKLKKPAVIEKPL